MSEFASVKHAPTNVQLTKVMAVATDAAQAISALGYDVSVERKDDKSPVTEADHASQAVIDRGLEQFGLPVIGEEGEAPLDAYLAARGQPAFWLVDPLDGTKEYIKGTGEYAVSLALIYQGRAELGIVLAPESGRWFAGVVGVGAWAGQAGESRAIKFRDWQLPPVVYASRSHGGGEADVVERAYGSAELASMGSCLKFGGLAAAEADLYLRLKPTSLWDTAGGQAILEAAGGVVMHLDGREFRYDDRDTLINPGFLAVADRSGPWRKILEALPN